MARRSRRAAAAAGEAKRRGRPAEQGAQSLILERTVSPPKTRQQKSCSQPPSPSTPPKPEGKSRGPKSAKGKRKQKVYLQECTVDGETYRTGDSAYVTVETGSLVRHCFDKYMHRQLLPCPFCSGFRKVRLFKCVIDTVLLTFTGKWRLS